jgi:hypothetical protein
MSDSDMHNTFTHLTALTGMYAIVETRGLIATNTTQHGRAIELCGQKKMCVSLTLLTSASNYCPELFITQEPITLCHNMLLAHPNYNPVIEKKNFCLTQTNKINVRT